MPTSPFKWQSQQQVPPSYNTFGTKRKVDCEMEFDSEDVISEKRRCLRACEGVESDAVEQQQAVYEEQRHQHEGTTAVQGKDVEESVDCSEMDVDGGVDTGPRGPAIGSDATFQTPPQVTMTAEAEKEFCEEYCGYGVVSPKSGSLRCYCRPSWDGMMTAQPFISDCY